MFLSESWEERISGLGTTLPVSGRGQLRWRDRWEWDKWFRGSNSTKNNN